jgi:hypothetical protein
MRVMPCLIRATLKLDQQAQALAGQLQVSRKLLLVHGRDGLDGFDFDDHLVFHQQIRVKTIWMRTSW